MKETTGPLGKQTVADSNEQLETRIRALEAEIQLLKDQLEQILKKLGV